MEFNFFFINKEVLLALVVLSPWPIFFSYMFYYALGGFPNYKAVIRSKKDTCKHLFLLGLVLICSMLIFRLRLEKRGKKVDLYNYLETLLGQLKFGDPEESYIIILGLTLLGIFWLLGIKLMYMYVKRSFITLHSYLYAYKWYDRRVMSKIPGMRAAYMFYLVRRVELFTKNEFILYSVCFYIWPTLFEKIEGLLVRLLIPYLYILDIVVNQGVISKVFDVLPWMFLYTGIKLVLKNLRNMLAWEITQMSGALYDSQEIKENRERKEKENGKPKTPQPKPNFPWLKKPKKKYKKEGIAKKAQT